VGDEKVLVAAECWRVTEANPGFAGRVASLFRREEKDLFIAGGNGKRGNSWGVTEKVGRREGLGEFSINLCARGKGDVVFGVDAMAERTSDDEASQAPPIGRTFIEQKREKKKTTGIKYRGASSP